MPILLVKAYKEYREIFLFLDRLARLNVFLQSSGWKSSSSTCFWVGVKYGMNLVVQSAWVG